MGEDEEMALDGGVSWECYWRVRGRGPSRGGWSCSEAPSHAAVCGWGRRTKGLGSERGEYKLGPGLHKYLSTKLFHNIMNRIRKE